VALFFVSFVRLRDHIASGANKISWRLRDVSHVLIGDVVKRDRVKDLPLEGNLRSVIEGYCYCKRGLRYAKPSRNADFLCRLYGL
jgi:hypothetical protein